MHDRWENFRAAVAVLAVTGLALASCERSGATANPSDRSAAGTAGCDGMPGNDALRDLLRQAADQGGVGGMFGGRAQWGAVVNRSGAVCAIVAINDSVGGRWPGSRNVARAKAYTANGFSTDTLPMSTARLYTLTQPGHSLWGIAQANPFDPECLNPEGEGVCGGAIAFGGGVPLYRNGKVVGGLGVSGDTPCADHEIAKRVRTLAKLDFAKGPAADDIQYSKTDGATVFTHPLCLNTFRNGQKIGDEAPAVGY